MSFDPDSFLADVLSNVSEDKRKGIEEALKADPKVLETIGKGYSRQSDYSRQMDELKKERETASEELNKQKGAFEATKARYQEWYEDANREFKAAIDKAARYEQEYGELENFDPASKHKLPENLMTKEDVAREFERRDRAAIDFADALTDVKIDFRDRFNERLDTKALYDHIEKTQLPFKAAYEDFIRPRVTEAENAKLEERIKQAREEGYREGVSKASLPVEPDPNRPRPMDSLGASTTQDDRVAAAAAAWRESQSR